MIAERLRPFYDAQAKKRKLSTLKQNAAVPQEVAERKTGDARSEAGRAAGVNHTYVDQASIHERISECAHVRAQLVVNPPAKSATIANVELRNLA